MVLITETFIIAIGLAILLVIFIPSFAYWVIVQNTSIFTQQWVTIIWRASFYSTVTTFAKFLGLSGFMPLFIERWYANNCIGIIPSREEYDLFSGT